MSHDDQSLQVEIPFAIPGDETGGRLVVVGDRKNARRVVLFCAGFPDDWHVFLPLARRLAYGNKNGTVLCGITCMPGYNRDYSHHHHRHATAGYTFDECVSALREATKVLLAYAAPDNNNATAAAKLPLTGVFHDWGCVVGAMCAMRLNREIPRTFQQLVYFDIVPLAHKSCNVELERSSFRKAMLQFSYTAVFAVCHAVHRFVSTFLATVFLAISVGGLRMTCLLPTGPRDAATFHARQPQLAPRKLLFMMYPYFNMYKALLQGKRNPLGPGFYLPANLKETPVLYMYGTEKRLQFHDENVLAWLTKEASQSGTKSKVVAVENAGHWLYLQQPDICFEAVKTFIGES